MKKKSQPEVQIIMEGGKDGGTASHADTPPSFHIKGEDPKVIPPLHHMQVVEVPIDQLRFSDCNPRTWSKEAITQLKESIRRHGLLVPLLVNSAPGRYGMVIGGNFRLKILIELGYTTVQVIFLAVPDVEKEREITIRLNKNVGDWDQDALAKLDEDFLRDIGFTSEEIDNLFGIEDTPEEFDLEKELERMDIKQIEVKPGDRYALGRHILMCGDSTRPEDVQKLMGTEKADLVLTDPPYILDYNSGKRKSPSQTKEGFGLRRNRKYLGTDVLPENFTTLWMTNVAQVVAKHSSIICYENWKNIPVIWDEMEKHWKVRNMLVWRLPNRVQGFSAKYRFFNKYDIALVGTAGDVPLHTEDEEELFHNEYVSALVATCGSPHWEPYKKGGKYCPTDVVEFRADDAKHSGQNIIFGTKPIEILIPYLKVLTVRDALVIEPFGGSGSTMIACEKMHRRCRIMEKSPVYAEVIMKRWEKLTNQTRRKI